MKEEAVSTCFEKLAEIESSNTPGEGVWLSFTGKALSPFHFLEIAPYEMSHSVWASRLARVFN